MTEPTTPAPPTLADIVGSYGPVDVQPLSRIAALTARAMTRSWTTIPHVTHNDLLAIAPVEAARATANAAGGVRLSLLPYLVKAVAATLTRFPRFAAAYDEAGGTLILRNYVNVGVAVDTPAGLMVPVVRGCDAKSVREIGEEIVALAERARAKRLPLADMSGGCFTVSSLGALGGSGFTPIINAPEVAILGVGRTIEQPRRGPGDAIEWAAMLPVSLSYDHRVINGADAGRFLAGLQEELGALAGG